MRTPIEVGFECAVRGGGGGHACWVRIGYMGRGGGRAAYEGGGGLGGGSGGGDGGGDGGGGLGGGLGLWNVTTAVMCV